MAETMENRPDTDPVSLPAEGQQTLYELIAALVFTGLVVWSGHTLMQPGTLPIKQVRIEGEFQNLSTQVLQDLIRTEVTGGFFNINVSAIRNALLSEPWVNEVSVHRVWPDSLQVYVDEQVAVTRWNRDGLLNRKGELFRPERETIPAQLPLLQGPAKSQSVMLEHYRYLEKMLRPVGMSVAELYLNDRRSWEFRTTAGLRVLIGNSSFQERVERFVKQVPVSLAGSIENLEQVDMRYPNGFAVRWKQSVAGQQETGAL